MLYGAVTGKGRQVPCGGIGKEEEQAKRARERGRGTKCTAKGPVITLKGKQVAMALKDCGEKGPRGTCTAGERKGEENNDGGGSRECFFFQNENICPYMNKWGDCKFEHRGERGGNDERGRGRRGEKRGAPGGAGEGGQEQREGRMRARALPGRRASDGKVGVDGRVQAQRGSPCGLERLGDQRHWRGDTKVGQTDQFR